MGKYKFLDNKFGEFNTIVLKNDVDGTQFEIALQGATPINYKINMNENHFDILDGFGTPEEFKAAKGARCWIMIPFANRIPDGVYQANNKTFKLNPVPPRSEVIHGFASYGTYAIKDVKITDSYIDAVLSLKDIRPGKFNGYPFAIDVEISYKLENNKMTVQIAAENIGSDPAPFSTGWHPYFKTSDKGIEHLIFTLNAEEIVVLDNKNIPLPGQKAFGNINNYPHLDYRSSVPEEKRIINNRILDNCFSKVAVENDGYSRSSIYDPENGLKITLFQKGGVTLAFSGDTLAQRKRNSVAIEPMQFITNAFNREELKEKILINPGSKTIFEFGVEISK